MKYSRDFIDKLKQSVDLVELVSEYTELKKAGRHIWIGKCPHPKHDDSTASFIVYTNTNSWCCYGCHMDKKDKTNKKSDRNYGSDCIAFIQWINEDKMSWIECVQYLAKKVDLPLPIDSNMKKYETNKKLNKKFIKDMPEHVKTYCKSRGLDSYDIAKYQLGYDKTTNRLTFPLYDAYNNVLGFNKRRLNDADSRKYIHTENNSVFNKSNYLYNINNINKDYKYVYITEGVFDVILAEKYGLKNVVCTLGTAFTENHYNIINKLNLTPVLLYDNDNKGIMSIKSAAELIYSKGSYPLMYILPEGYDLADFSLEKKYKLSDIVEKNIMTYGYLKSNEIVKNYLSELYLLRAKYRPQINDILKAVPEEERNDIESFFRNEIRM